MNRRLEKWFAPVDISSVAFFRIGFGAIMLWEVCRYVSYGWVYLYYIGPEYHFPYEGFEWIRPFADENMYLHFFFLGLLAFCIMLGLFYRVVSVLFFLGFTYVFLLDKSYYLNHFYLISLLSFLMMFLPVNRAWSLDVKIWPRIRTDYVPAWVPGLLAFQLGVAYFYGGLAKLNWDWLRGQPMFLWLGRKSDWLLIGDWMREAWFIYFVSYSGLLLDLLVVPALIWKRTRIPAFILITLFHVTNHFLWQIGIFPWFMIAATTIYFRPDWFRLGLQKLGLGGATATPPSPPVPRLQGASWIALALAVWAGFQLLFPLRHFLEPGNVSWHERGHRFAWHMKLRDKRAKKEFTVKDLDKNELWEIDLDDLLSPRQQRKMGTRPDMILQFAHYLAEEFAKEGITNIAVHAEVTASLNGRRFQQFIRPEVNLLEITPSTPPQKWIVPMENSLPPTNHIRL